VSIGEILFGRPLRNRDQKQERIGPLPGIPVLGLDALASAAYGPEAALAVLMPLGALASFYIIPISLLIIVLLVIVSLSYRQTIPAYPQGGGSFTVAKENLGTLPGLLAASALSIDYILNVAVAISAGVGALVSAVPPLVPYTLFLCLVILVILTVANLRGIHSAGLVFMFPTYLFLLCLSVSIAIGLAKIGLAHGHPVPVVKPAVPDFTGIATAWLLVRAFASGCTALTGVEAVSNAVPIFEKPTVVLARRTLSIIMTLLGLLLAGIAILARSYGIGAMDQGLPGYQSVLSQMIGAVSGRGVFYYISMAAILMVLSLSANTSFADFPRVCRVLAVNEFLPPGFAHRGRRLVYSHGIVILAVLSGALLAGFGGRTDRLIPLFAIGAFLAFTLSQLGMVFHWLRSRDAHTMRSLVLNGLGACATGATLLVVAVSKFTEGAWLTIVVIPPFVLLFLWIRKRQRRMEKETAADGPLDMTRLDKPIVVIPIRRLSRVARNAVRLAVTLSQEVYAVQILAEDLHVRNLSRRWAEFVGKPCEMAGRCAPELVVLKSSYREFFDPFLSYVSTLSSRNPERTVLVIVPELVLRRWYHLIIPHRATLIKELLLLKGGPCVAVMNAPLYVGETCFKGDERNT
jgi:amino acid transporter